MSIKETKQNNKQYSFNLRAGRKKGKVTKKQMEKTESAVY